MALRYSTLIDERWQWHDVNHIPPGSLSKTAFSGHYSECARCATYFEFHGFDDNNRIQLYSKQDPCPVGMSWLRWTYHRYW